MATSEDKEEKHFLLLHHLCEAQVMQQQEMLFKSEMAYEMWQLERPRFSRYCWW